MYGRPVTRGSLGAELDAARALVAERDLTVTAAGALTDVVRALSLDALAPVKQLLKRFFSGQPWTETDDDALAEIVGPGTGTHELALDADLTLHWGWRDGRFTVRVANDDDLALTFASDVYPEVTPSPRTIRFTTPPLHSGASQVFDARTAAEDPRVARLFREFAMVTNVLVGPTFVAVTIAHPDQWETVLGSMLRTVAEEFTGATRDSDSAAPAGAAAPADRAEPESVRAPRRLERAWAELGSLRAERPDDLARILDATRDDEPARRQVAAALLADAPDEVARVTWTTLAADASRSVRRSTIDAVVDAAREELRPLLERALGDTDAWVRWKAVHGLAALGAEPSRNVIAARSGDPDFRVRLEAARAIG